jgi:EmrB/QacA subfamily drug resistance transporter
MARTVPDYRWVIVLVGLTLLIVTTDFSIISVALPSIGRQLRVAPAALSWVISAGSLTYAGFLVLSGRASDIFGQRACMLTGLCLFGTGSLIAAASPSLAVLVAARALQGVGAAILTPANFSLINTHLPEGAPRRQAMGVFGIMQGLSLVIGLLIGGSLTTHFGWRAVFLLNPPIALLAIALTLKAVPPLAERANQRQIDWLGAALIVAGTGLLLLGVSRMGREGWSAPGPLALAAGGVVAFVLFFLAERRARAPLAPPAMFARRNFSSATVILLLHLAGVGGLFVLTSLYMQSGLKLSALRSGLGMMPYAAAVMLAGQLAPPIMARAPLRLIVIGGFCFYLAGLVLLALLSGEHSYWIALALGSVVCGFGSTTSFMALMAEATADIPEAQQGAASAVLFTAQQIGVPLGVTAALSVIGAAGGEMSMSVFRDGYLAMAIVIGLALAGSLLALRRPPALALPTTLAHL